MENKNTMLLTVVAVVTLLVAVVGATFAYFSITGTGSATTTVSTSTESVGAVTLSTELAALHLDTTAAMFAQGVNGTYYAGTTDGTYASAKGNHNVIKVESKQGSENAVYRCTFTFGVATPGTPADLTVDDMTVSIGGIYTQEFPVKGNENYSKTVTVFLKGNTTKYVTVDVALNALGSTPQNYLQGQNLTTTVSASNFACTIVDSVGTDGAA